MKIALGIEYDGGAYRGWQLQQAGVSTVQLWVERAVSKVADEAVTVICAGRTDAGVHARGQVAHFETSAVRSERAWALGCNVNLPPDIGVLWAKPVADDFHARFSGRARSYRYAICNRWVRPALLSGRVSWFRQPLDAERMAAAARYLLGEHDFTSFRAQGCQAKSPVRTMYRAEVTRRDDILYLDLTANAFLHHMVRNIAGVLAEVGSGEREPEWVEELLRLRDRTLGGVTAPPDGLYFVGVRYPEEYGILAPPPPPVLG